MEDAAPFANNTLGRHAATPLRQSNQAHMSKPTHAPSRTPPEKKKNFLEHRSRAPPIVTAFRQRCGTDGMRCKSTFGDVCRHHPSLQADLLHMHRPPQSLRTLTTKIHKESEVLRPSSSMQEPGTPVPQKPQLDPGRHSNGPPPTRPTVRPPARPNARRQESSTAPPCHNSSVAPTAPPPAHLRRLPPALAG